MLLMISPMDMIVASNMGLELAIPGLYVVAASTATAIARLKSGSEVISARRYCRLHGCLGLALRR